MANAYINEYYDAMINRLKEKASKAVKKALDDTWKEYFTHTEEVVKELFNKAIDEFFADYSPIIYRRRGRDDDGSLYGILKTEVDKDGTYLQVGYDPDFLTYRNGASGGESGLYDLVFRKGYHGGAYKEDDKGSEFATPYWKTAISHFREWGRPAAKSTPPIQVVRERVEEYEKEKSQSDFSEIWNRNKNNIKINW